MINKLFYSDIWITQRFGVNYEYYKKFGLKGHEGLDCIPSRLDWSVLALGDGIVVRDVDNALSGVYGINVTIWHPQLKKVTQYCHLSENYVNLNRAIRKGDVIGKMGNTGNTNGAHLHLNIFDTTVEGVRINTNNGYFGGTDPELFLNQETPPVIGGDDMTDDERRALEVLKKFIQTSTDGANNPFGNLEGYANTLAQDAYKVYKNPLVITTPAANLLDEFRVVLKKILG